MSVLARVAITIGCWYVQLRSYTRLTWGRQDYWREKCHAQCCADANRRENSLYLCTV